MEIQNQSEEIISIHSTPEELAAGRAVLEVKPTKCRDCNRKLEAKASIQAGLCVHCRGESIGNRLSDWRTDEVEDLLLQSRNNPRY